MSPSPLRTSVTEQVFASLMEDVVSGRYAPGERLPTQRRLAEDFGVNLGSVREALKRLEQLKLVDVRHGEAMRVRDWRADGGLEVLAQAVLSAGALDPALMGAMLEARTLLLAESARLAAARATSEAAARLGEIADALAAEKGDGAQALDWAFWAELVEAADNVVFRLVTNTLRDLYFAHAERFRGLVAPELAPGYAAIAAAVTAGNGEAAARETSALAERQAAALR